MNTIGPASSNIPYVRKFFHGQSPPHMAYVAARAGVRAQPLQEPFTYCELGCGHGLTSLILADALPQGQFIGIDVDDRHIASARALVERAHVPNVRFLTADIREHATLDLPQFDFVSLHGLISWVAEPVRAGILDFLRQRLSANGLVYVSYNAQPGGRDHLVLRELAHQHIADLDLSPADRIQAAVDHLVRLRDEGAPAIAESPRRQQLIDDIQEQDVAYLAHEYFAFDYKLFSLISMTRWMAEAGLSYLGSLRLETDIPEAVLPRRLAADIRAIDDPVRRRHVQGLLLNESFRVDLFARAPARPEQAAAALADMTFTLSYPDDTPKALRFRNMRIDLSERRFDAIRDALNDGVLSLSPDDPHLEVATYMMAAHAIQPVASPVRRDVAAPLRRPRLISDLNRIFLEQGQQGRSPVWLTTPVLGSGVKLSSLATLVLDAALADDSAPLPERALSRMAPPECYWPDEPDLDRSEAVRRLQEFLPRFEQRIIPWLIRLGIIADGS